MIIKEYENNYLDDVIHLFVEEYGVKFSEYKQTFIQFFEHEFQKNKCIRIMAVDQQGGIIGFQSFFYWPYIRQNKVYNAYQSGSSIVSKKARGKGVFQKMLDYADTVRDKYKIDFLMGFPVEASYKSFMSNGWSNPFNLQWYMKVRNPIGFLFSWLYRSNNEINTGLFSSTERFSLQNSSQFLEWRRSFQKDKYRVFKYSSGNMVFEVNHKINKRKTIFNELIIGEVLSNSNDPAFIVQAFKKYYRWLFFQLDISFISFATNDENDAISKQVLNYGLKKINRKIYFITKYADKMKPADWQLFRSDIDTW